jgi:hypothetical protein
MKRILVPVVILSCLFGPAEAQPEDGTIISREAVALPEGAPEDVRVLVKGVTLERIIYASDGLEVEGFLARPTQAAGEKLPCVIFNRWRRAITGATGNSGARNTQANGYAVIAKGRSAVSGARSSAARK